MQQDSQKTISACAGDNAKAATPQMPPQHNRKDQKQAITNNMLQIVLKRGFDLLFAVLLLAPFTLFLIILTVFIKKDGGPIFFSHARVGKNYRPFKCYKFRTMVTNPDKALADYLKQSPAAKAEWQEHHKLKDDPRITKVGAFLRKSSVDELPQLFNILKGEMSVVGPRPITQPELERYGQYAGIYASVKPGLTGLWQVSGRNDISYDDRVQLDVDYVERQNFWLDMKILAKTVKVVLNRNGC